MCHNIFTFCPSALSIIGSDQIICAKPMTLAGWMANLADVFTYCGAKQMPAAIISSASEVTRSALYKWHFKHEENDFWGENKEGRKKNSTQELYLEAVLTKMPVNPQKLFILCYKPSSVCLSSCTYYSPGIGCNLICDARTPHNCSSLVVSALTVPD